MKRVTWSWTARVLALGLMLSPAVASAQWKLTPKRPLFGPKPNYCPPAPCPVCPPAPEKTEPETPPAPKVEDDKSKTPMDQSQSQQQQNQQNQQDQQNQQQQQQTPQLNVPSPAQVAGSTGTNAAPDMIGDFFGLGTINGSSFGPGFNGFGGSISGGSGLGNLILDPVNNTMFFVSGDLSSANVVPSVQFQDAGGGSLVPDGSGNIGNLQGFNTPMGGGGAEAVPGVFTASPTGDIIDTVTTPNGVVNNAVVYNVQQNLTGVNSPNGAATQFNIGTLKIAEGTSPIPRDRFIFNYSYFDNATVIPTGVDVNRFAPGFEKTFWDQQASFQCQIPFASTLQNDVTVGADNSLIGGNDVVLGDLTMVLKAVLFERCNFLMSAGLQMTVPTSDDQTISVTNPFDTTGTDRRLFAQLESQSVHLMPFIGSVYNRDRWFIQSVMQFDFDANGNTLNVNTNPFGDGTTLTRQGVLQSQNYIFLDLSVAYQIYRARCNQGWGISSIAPVAELHYNRSLNSADGVTVVNNTIPVYTFGAAGAQFESMNAVAGTAILMKRGGAWLIGYGTPIVGGSDREFDGELRVFYSYRFGGGRNNCDGTGYSNSFRGGNLRTGIF